MSLYLGIYSDYTPILPVDIEVEGNTEALIELRARNDAVTLEYDDTVILLFSPDESDLIEFYENEGEYIRSSVAVHIMDSDREFDWTIILVIYLYTWYIYSV